jgi:hypothetical protein
MKRTNSQVLKQPFKPVSQPAVCTSVHSVFNGAVGNKILVFNSSMTDKVQIAKSMNRNGCDLTQPLLRPWP